MRLWTDPDGRMVTTTQAMTVDEALAVVVEASNKLAGRVDALEEHRATDLQRLAEAITALADRVARLEQER